MARFSGLIGFGTMTEVRPGVHEEVITERPYRGDTVQSYLRQSEGDTVNVDFALSQRISVVVDPFARDNLYAMRYVTWAGVRWSITSVELLYPRLTLRLGGVYNGPTAGTP